MQKEKVLNNQLGNELSTERKGASHPKSLSKSAHEDHSKRPLCGFTISQVLPCWVPNGSKGNGNYEPQ